MPIDIPTSEELLARSDALQAGLDFLQKKCRERAPKLTGRLAESIETRKTSETSGEVYTRLIYAPKQERRGWQKHTHGGMAHYMAITFQVDGPETWDQIGTRLFEG